MRVEIVVGNGIVDIEEVDEEGIVKMIEEGWGRFRRVRKIKEESKSREGEKMDREVFEGRCGLRRCRKRKKEERNERKKKEGVIYRFNDIIKSLLF